MVCTLSSICTSSDLSQKRIFFSSFCLNAVDQLEQAGTVLLEHIFHGQNNLTNREKRIRIENRKRWVVRN